MTDTKTRGLGSTTMDPQTKHDIQSKGGHTAAAHQDMKKLGKKGGQASSQKRSSITQKGGMMDPQNAMHKVKETVQKAGKKGGNATMMGAAAGSVIGAVAGGLAGAALADKNTRENLGQKITHFTKTAADTAEKLSAKATEVTEEARSTADQLSHESKNEEKKARSMN